MFTDFFGEILEIGGGGFLGRPVLGISDFVPESIFSRHCPLTISKARHLSGSLPNKINHPLQSGPKSNNVGQGYRVDVRNRFGSKSGVARLAYTYIYVEMQWKQELLASRL